MKSKTGSIIAIAPMHNTPGRHDATGAFIPEAKRFLKYHAQPNSCLHLIDNHLSKARMYPAVRRVIDDPPSAFSGIAFFCHGYRTGIQFGITTKNMTPLTDVIAGYSEEDVAVTCYCCDVARDSDRHRQDDLETMGGDGGFCDELRDHLCVSGAVMCVVDGHTTAGHTTRNPDVRRFLGAGSDEGGVGGHYIVARAKRQLFKKWRQALRTNFRFQYPYLSDSDIMGYLGLL